MTALPAPVLPNPEVGRLHRVLEDVRFLLERGCWQAALTVARDALARDALARTALAHDERTPTMSPQTQAATDA
jgi:hypothetical protein